MIENKMSRLSIKSLEEMTMISKFGSICAFQFVLLSFVGRFLFPFGDEPDFEYRSLSVVFADDHPWWSPYFIFHNIFSTLNRNGICDIQSSPFSLWATIPTGCTEEVQQILMRFFLTVIIVSPLLLLIIFQKFFISIIDPKFTKLTQGEWQLRLDALAVSLLLPSVVYLLGVFAEEQFVLVLSLMLSFFLSRIILVGILLFFIINLDFGNGLVVLTAVISTLVNRLLARKFGFRMLMIALLIQLTITINIGFVYFDAILNVDLLANKVNEISSMLSSDDSVANKYPIILRPIVTFMSAIFMTSQNVKVIPLYVFFTIAFVIGVMKFNKLNPPSAISAHGFNYRRGEKNFDECKLLLLNSIYVTLFFVFLLPTYSNAKYYLFLTPLIMMSALQVFTRNQIRIAFFYSSFIVYAFLILYRLV